MSDRPTDRPVPRLARASARKRAYTDDGTNDGTITDRGKPAPPAPHPTMSYEERDAIRQAGADDARRSRVEHGFPERIEDPAAVAVLAAILRGTRKRAPPGESTSNKGNTAA